MNWFDAQEIVNSFGDWAALAVTLVIFLETAFIVTSFLPGDSLLFITGLTLAASDSWLPDWLGFILIWVAAVTGTQVGYWIGRKVGPPLFAKNRNFILNDKVIARTHAFFDRYGARAIILARFIPILRALVPILAGISEMEAKRFTRLNLIGGTLWVGIFMIPGYLLGEISWVKENLEITVIAIVVLTSLILPFELLRDWLQRRAQKSNAN